MDSTGKSRYGNVWYGLARRGQLTRDLGPAVSLENAYFGDNWGAAMLEDMSQVPTPVGVPCSWCREPVAEGEAGVIRALLDGKQARLVPIHRECDLRGVIGSVGHQRGTCSCFVRPGDDQEEGLTRREAAQAAEREFYSRPRSWLFDSDDENEGV